MLFSVVGYCPRLSEQADHGCLNTPSYSAVSLSNKQENPLLHWHQGPSPLPATVAASEPRSEEEEEDEGRCYLSYFLLIKLFLIKSP